MLNAISSLLGSSDANNLLGFYSKFGEKNLLEKDDLAFSINPNRYFDLSFDFYPKSSDPLLTGSGGSFFSNMTEKVSQAVTAALNTAINNFTAGLGDEREQFKSARDEQIATLKQLGASSYGRSNLTLVEYLLKYALVSNEKDLRFFFQSAVLPSFTVEDIVDINYNDMTNISLPINLIKPSDNKLVLHMLDTEYSLHEHVFYPWMRETTLNYWVYNKQPYTTATIKIDLIAADNVKVSRILNDLKNVVGLGSDTSDVFYSYIFTGCRPTFIESPAIDHAPQNKLTRPVIFTFNNMYVKSSYFNVRSVASKAAAAVANRLLSNALQAGVNEINTYVDGTVTKASQTAGGATSVV